MATIRILLVEDQAIVREALKSLIQTQTGMEVVGEAEDGESAILLAAQLKPDIIVMDVGLPGMNGAEATREIKRLKPDIPVIALTMHEDQPTVRKLVAAGVSGYVVKRSAVEDLIRSLRAVAAGGSYFDPIAAQSLVPAVVPSTVRAREPLGPNLSPVEIRVAQLIARGLSHQEISAQMNLSLDAVMSYRVHILEKLGIQSRVELVRYAIQQGWLPK